MPTRYRKADVQDLAPLNALHERMSAQQRALIMQAATADILPSSGALAQIAGLEGALGAVDTMLDQKPSARSCGPAPTRAAEPTRQPPASRNQTMTTGTVKWFNATKGYGFIAPDDGGPDAFVHISAVERAGMRELHEGEKLSYELKADPKTGKSSAVDLKPAE